MCNSFTILDPTIHTLIVLPIMDPLSGLCLGPAGDLKRSPDPSPTHAPLTTNPGSAPGTYIIIRCLADINLCYYQTVVAPLMACRKTK
jgi:hypothetical protein